MSRPALSSIRLVPDRQRIVATSLLGVVRRMPWVRRKRIGKENPDCLGVIARTSILSNDAQDSTPADLNWLVIASEGHRI